MKTHEAPLHGKVVRLRPDYGFIRTSDRQDIYFHRNSVADGGFQPLKVGGEMRFVLAEREGEEAPQASTVMAIGKHHMVG